MDIRTRKISDDVTFDEIENISNQIMEFEANYKPVNIICPRCGKNLGYIERGDSYMIKCETPDCINYGVRGI